MADALPPLRDIVARYGLDAKKTLGQNFLFDLNLTARIARAAGPFDDTIIVEIGPGLAALTAAGDPVQVVEYLETRLRRFPGRMPATSPLFVDNKGRPMGRGALQYLVEQLYREAGIRTRVPRGALVHALRHTFATSLARNGASGVELQRLLGHESLATTQRYIDASAREVRAAARTNEAYRTLQTLLDGEA